jgi:hypothetical protein
MATKAGPSETLALWARAAQARRVAGMLSPKDAQLAEAYAVECEQQARDASFKGLRSTRLVTAHPVANVVFGAVARSAPRQILFCEEDG